MSATSTPSKSSLTALKVADLKALCAKASLPISGTKADLITRLLSTTVNSASPDTNTSLPAQVPPSTTVSLSASGGASAAKPAASVVPANASQISDPSVVKQLQTPTTTSDATPNGKTDESHQSAVEAEIAKRAQRAQRFGLAASDDKAGSEELKKLERAKKFGCEPTAVKIEALDRALGERGDRSKRSNGPNATPAKTTELTPTDLEWEERKRKRAEKFGITVESSVETKKAKA
ncbi:uncharacterized protein MELLADRAFT_85773 [Melampsora larici-populina 98AG31]|uniref:SAP domain-containing protein n=1 Tax=Melampsora larici-populina (strain 98AG31 / pathotype 3-4-7) TaxID=747676 RepID=F4RJQ7_MELLP|nr:uncharacterized protein MELLADRAFT_85773 [Melampsora larici-populina 98AG31]EGG07453.1 hypothetical protein MELLADRAFT_85773 [Melampsora larici-populina 98AG31]